MAAWAPDSLAVRKFIGSAEKVFFVGIPAIRELHAHGFHVLGRFILAALHFLFEGRALLRAHHGEYGGTGSGFVGGSRNPAFIANGHGGIVVFARSSHDAEYFIAL